VLLVQETPIIPIHDAHRSKGENPARFPHTSPSPARMYALDILQAHFEARELIVGITDTDCFALLQFSPVLPFYNLALLLNFI
jgi:hypothetical protein